jgi:hypothetical protein
LKSCGIEQNEIVISIVTNSDADWSFGKGRAQFSWPTIVTALRVRMLSPVCSRKLRDRMPVR